MLDHGGTSWRRLRRGQRRGRLSARPGGHRPRPAGTGARGGAAVGRGGAARRRRRSPALPGRRGSRLDRPRASLRHARGQRPRRLGARRCSPGWPCAGEAHCWRGRRRSAPTRRSRPGCSRPSGWARTARSLGGRRTSSSAWSSGRRGRARADDRGGCERRLLKLTAYFGERERARGRSSPTCCSTCTATTRSRRAC